MANRYYRATYSFGSTGAKFLSVDLGGDTPIGCRITGGPRANTTETAEIWSQGGSDGTRTHCVTTGPGFAKKWPYTSDPDYIIACYSVGGTKELSGTFDGFDIDEVDITIDDHNSQYQVIVEAWS